jgi:DNA-binding response OmpR family regulator
LKSYEKLTHIALHFILKNPNSWLYIFNYSMAFIEFVSILCYNKVTTLINQCEVQIMRILIIEDNKALSLQMKKGLESSGFSVDTAFEGGDGEEKAYSNAYDVILLDLNLPDKDGLEILKFLRSEDITTPVIIITARDEVEELAHGLDSGADDYVTKPFEILELRARIQAVIRRFQGRTNPLITVGKLQLNPKTRIATYNEVVLNLKAKEFDILECIAGRNPEVVSSEEIAEHVYDENYDPFSSVLRVHIAKLKKALKEVAGFDLLQTIRGKGYVLCQEDKKSKNQA